MSAVPKPSGMKYNSHNWRWMVVRWLTGGEIEAVPVLPFRPIYGHETIRVTLGKPGALNVAEVKHPDMASTFSLLPIEDVRDLYPDTFVMVEIKGTDGRLYPQIGHFRGWRTDNHQRQIMLELRNGETYAWPARDVYKAYYAPVGFQLEWLEGGPGSAAE